MEYRLFKNNLIWYIAAGVVLLSLGVIIATSTTRLARADDNVASVDERVITLHDDGVDKGFITKKATLREALAEQNIRVDANDRTEPGLDEKLVAHSYQVNVYRARPVVIRDGGSETKITTSYRSAKQIAKQAQMTLHDEDKVEMSVSMNPINDGASEVMNVTRATPFMFNFYGKVEQNYTLAKTVGDMLKEKGIKMGKDDGITPALSTPITSGMEVKLWRNGVQTVTVDEDIAFDTKQVKDADHDIGYKEVQTPGENGKRTVTYEINMQNGVEVLRKEINSNTTKQPVQQVEIIGTKVSLPAGSHEDWMAAAGISSSDFGYVNYIVGRESGWRYNAQGYSTTYGLCQAYPGGKMSSAGADWETNPITQLKWCTSYATSRYGSWQNAYNHWLSSHNW